MHELRGKAPLSCKIAFDINPLTCYHALSVSCTSFVLAPRAIASLPFREQLP